MFPISMLENIIVRADFLILALPLTNDTKLIITEKELNLLPESAVVINLGRGELISEEAIARVLSAKRIRGAALDVFWQEPLPPESPLWQTPNLLITPHMAAKTNRFLDRCIDTFIQNYDLYIQGKSLMNQANFVQGY
ncbi:MAG: NAD(P)-dependent oxidoreductase [Desulfitobacteriaceae bacterium]